MGLLSRSISVQELKNPWLKTLVLERRGREPRGREGWRQGEDGGVCSVFGWRKGREERVRGI